MHTLLNWNIIVGKMFASISPSSLSGIITQAYPWVLQTCTSGSSESKTTRSFGGPCTTRDPVGTRSPSSWDASHSRSRSLWLRSASVCLMGSPPWMMSPSRTVRCPLRWRSARRAHISTACGPKRVWSTSSSVTLWMTVGMDPMRKDVVSVSFGYKYPVVMEVFRSFT